jgi:hypothetical protein
MGTEFDLCAHHAAASTVATSFMIYTFLGVEGTWHKRTGKHKVLFVKQEILINFLNYN